MLNLLQPEAALHNLTQHLQEVVQEAVIRAEDLLRVVAVAEAAVEAAAAADAEDNRKCFPHK
jgi:hypothetical protein